jgi:undecaprenyl-diphosphatase
MFDGIGFIMGDSSFQLGRWLSTGRDGATRLSGLARRELAAVVAMLVAAVGVWAFLDIADEVAEGETHAVDQALLLMLRMTDDPTRTVGPLWLRTALMDLTSLGSLAVLALVVLLIAGLFASLRRWRDAAVLIVAAAGGTAISQILKAIFDRPRPEESLRLVEAVNASFPSGHAMMSAVIYLTLGTLVARFARRRRIKLFAFGAGVALTLIVGVSRVYLGVHWPSDVLAGWCVGAAWAMGCWLVMWAVEKRWGRDVASLSRREREGPAP